VPSWPASLRIFFCSSPLIEKVGVSVADDDSFLLSSGLESSRPRPRLVLCASSGFGSRPTMGKALLASVRFRTLASGVPFSLCAFHFICASGPGCSLHFSALPNSSSIVSFSFVRWKPNPGRLCPFLRFFVFAARGVSALAFSPFPGRCLRPGLEVRRYPVPLRLTLHLGVSFPRSSPTYTWLPFLSG